MTNKHLSLLRYKLHCKLLFTPDQSLAGQSSLKFGDFGLGIDKNYTFFGITRRWILTLHRAIALNLVLKLVNYLFKKSHTKTSLAKIINEQ
jgi:hypothetical protein